ncbi:hypothetical protein CRN61_16565, partial [Vibrio vulnificus]
AAVTALAPPQPINIVREWQGHIERLYDYRHKGKFLKRDIPLFHFTKLTYLCIMPTYLLQYAQ